VHLENVVVDATDPHALGRFWEAALGTEQLTDEPEGYETRLLVPGGPVLDLCFQRVPEPTPSPRRLHLDLRGGSEQQSLVERLLGLGASHADIGQGDVPWVVLADPEGTPFCVLEERAAYADTGPLAAMVLDVADPERDREFWRGLTGWVPVDDSGLPALRHPSGLGPLLELRREVRPKASGKNPMHLDLRLEPGDDADAVAHEVGERGGREVTHPEWGELPWRFFTDPSGNDFCILPVSN
jgi:hypothetical protein